MHPIERYFWRTLMLPSDVFVGICWLIVKALDWVGGRMVKARRGF